MLCSTENRFGHGQWRCTSFFAHADLTKLQWKPARNWMPKPCQSCRAFQSFLLWEGQQVKCPLDMGHPALENGNAFFRRKMDRFEAVKVLRWRKMVDGMERLCSLLLAISSPWIMLDSEVYLQVPCRHPALRVRLPLEYQQVVPQADGLL